jgi:hypothetical protein
MSSSGCICFLQLCNLQRTSQALGFDLEPAVGNVGRGFLVMNVVATDNLSVAKEMVDAMKTPEAAAQAAVAASAIAAVAAAAAAAVPTPAAWVPDVEDPD